MTDHRHPTRPIPVGERPAAAKLIAFYRANGESGHVAELEAALTDEWRTTEQVAAAAGKSPHWARNALEYLAVEGRAEQQAEDLAKKFKGVSYRLVWRRPQ